MNEYKLAVADGRGVREAIVTIATVGDRCRVEVQLPDGLRVAADDGDYFAALLAVRRTLERDAIRLLCQGARRDVWPSGMAISMSAGMKAYVLVLGQHAARPALIDTFAPASADEVGTIAEQEAHRDAWFAEIRPR